METFSTSLNRITKIERDYLVKRVDRFSLTTNGRPVSMKVIVSTQRFSPVKSFDIIIKMDAWDVKGNVHNNEFDLSWINREWIFYSQDVIQR